MRFVAVITMLLGIASTCEIYHCLIFMNLTVSESPALNVLCCKILLCTFFDSFLSIGAYFFCTVVVLALEHALYRFVCFKLKSLSTWSVVLVASNS